MKKRAQAPAIKPVAAAVAATVAPSPRLAPARLSAQAFAQSDVLSAEAAESLKTALSGATYDEYEGVRGAWIGAYVAARNCTEDAASKAFSRLKTAAGVEKPKATGAENEKKQGQRDGAKAEKAELQTLAPDVIRAEVECLAVKGAQGDVKAAKRIATLKGELERRGKAVAKDARETERKLRADIAGVIKGLSLENLHRVQAFLNTLANPITAATTAPITKPARTLKKAA